MGVASRSQARHAQISRFLLVLGPEDVLALSKDYNNPLGGELQWQRRVRRASRSARVGTPSADGSRRRRLHLPAGGSSTQAFTRSEWKKELINLR